MPHLSYGLLCDDVRTEAHTNKHIVIGVWDRVTLRDNATPIPPFMVFGRLMFDDYKGQRIALDVIPPAGEAKTVFQTKMDVIADPRQETAFPEPNVFLLIGIRNLTLPMPGKYAIAIKVNGAAVGEIPFYARQAQPGEAIESATERPPPSEQSGSAS